MRVAASQELRAVTRLRCIRADGGSPALAEPSVETYLRLHQNQRLKRYPAQGPEQRLYRPRHGRKAWRKSKVPPPTSNILGIQRRLPRIGRRADRRRQAGGGLRGGERFNRIKQGKRKRPVEPGTANAGEDLAEQYKLARSRARTSRSVDRVLPAARRPSPVRHRQCRLLVRSRHPPCRISRRGLDRRPARGRVPAAARRRQRRHRHLLLGLQVRPEAGVRVPPSRARRLELLSVGLRQGRDPHRRRHRGSGLHHAVVGRGHRDQDPRNLPVHPNSLGFPVGTPWPASISAFPNTMPPRSWGWPPTATRQNSGNHSPRSWKSATMATT